MLCCAQRYSCAVEDLFFTQSARNAVNSHIREHLSDEQIQTACLLQECIMVRDGLARLPDVLRLVLCLISFVTCVCAECSVFLFVFYFFFIFIFHFFVCTLCTTDIINNKHK